MSQRLNTKEPIVFKVTKRGVILPHVLTACVGLQEGDSLAGWIDNDGVIILRKLTLEVKADAILISYPES